MKYPTLHKPVGMKTERAFWEGRFIFGSDAVSCSACLFVLCLIPILWQVEVGTFFMLQWSCWPVPVLMGLLHLASLSLLICTGLSDPGVIPKQKSFTEAYDPRTKSYRSRVPPRHFDVLLSGHPTKLKYCTTCSIYRPPRCTHCAICDDCVERFDHHCPWVGNCIGKRNYWLFYGFVSCIAALTVAVLATSIAEVVTLSRETGALLQAMRHAPLCALVVIVSGLISWFPIGLWVNHTYLISTNQTTYEQIKGFYSDATNPFHRGLAGNCSDVLCSRVRPSFLQSPLEVLYCGLAALPPVQVKGIRGLKVQSDEMDFDSVVSTAPPRKPLARDNGSDDQGLAVVASDPFLDLEEGVGCGPTPAAHRDSPSSTTAHVGGLTPPENSS